MADRECYLTQAEAALAKMRAGRAPYAINGRADLPAFEAIVAELRERREASRIIGPWLSAALDDPGVCDAMKTDIAAWFRLTPETDDA